MAFSVNTNGGALTALNQLGATRQTNLNTQSRINTGRDVNGPEDNAALFGIAQNLRAENSGRTAVANSLNRAQSVTDVALSAGSQVSDLLLRARELSVQASDPGLDDQSRAAINQEFTSVRDQINQVVESANFNGTNALASGGDDIQALTSPDGTTQTTTPNQDLSLGGPNVTLQTNADISTLAGAQQAFAEIETSAQNVNASLSALGSGSASLQGLADFNQLASDTTEVGIGNLVDANLAEAAADQAAGQVREQLGLISLNIANSQPQAILSLFEEQTT